jgi:hypothetical protein
MIIGYEMDKDMDYEYDYVGTLLDLVGTCACYGHFLRCTKRTQDRDSDKKKNEDLVKNKETTWHFLWFLIRFVHVLFGLLCILTIYRGTIWIYFRKSLNCLMWNIKGLKYIDMKMKLK